MSTDSRKVSKCAIEFDLAVGVAALAEVSDTFVRRVNWKPTEKTTQAHFHGTIRVIRDRQMKDLVSLIV